MEKLRILAAGVVAAAIVVLPATQADATPHRTGLRSAAVFVQLNGGDGNSIEAFSRDDDGRLTPVGTYATGGRGGKQAGAPVDALASQGGLVSADGGRVLIAVNAGSGTVSSLRVRDHGLEVASVVPSRGDFPSSATVHGSTVFVLNAGGTGSVSGYRLHDGVLRPIGGAVRSLGLSNAAVPAFLSSPAQIGFSPDGRTLVVTTKANGTIVSFPVRHDGRLGSAIVTSSQGPVPFSFVFDRAGRLHVQQAGDGRDATYRVAADSSLVPLGVSAPSGGAALCWSVRVGRFLYGANAGSATLTSWRIGREGLSSVSAPVAATTAAGPIDLAATADGRFVYVLSAVAGSVQAFAPDGHGGLVARGGVTGLPVIDATGGPEGIVAR